ncbi:tRNA-modifying protein YgfZ [Orbaceae bacterium ESL0727]|nr:tRNA-modifying protein YgfZ [Orbaceae bacterium ESL0727]
MDFSQLKQISLNDWQLIKVSGEDNQTYLQGQVTADIPQLTDQHSLFAAHCDAKGKMWSNLLLFKRDKDIFYIVRKSVADKQIAELKKYAIFAKVKIEAINDLNMLGVVGNLPQEVAAHLTTPDQNCLTYANTTYLRLSSPVERFIMITPQPLPTDLEPSTEWQLLDMQADYAIIDAPNIETLLPQACNLQHHNAISFDKGCYCGQEMVARAQFRGANKRALYLLSGTGNKLPIIGDTLEYQIGENWREGGQVLAALPVSDSKNQLYVQAVLNNDMDPQTTFRIKDDQKSHLAIK